MNETLMECMNVDCSWEDKVRDDVSDICPICDNPTEPVDLDGGIA